MRCRISGATYTVLAVVFAVAAAYLLYFVIDEGTLLGYALVLVFALGSAVAIRSARESFRGSRERRTHSD